MAEFAARVLGAETRSKHVPSSHEIFRKGRGKHLGKVSSRSTQWQKTQVWEQAVVICKVPATFSWACPIPGSLGGSTVTDLDIPNFLPDQQVHSYGSIQVLREKVLPHGRHHLIADPSDKVSTLTLTLII